MIIDVIIIYLSKPIEHMAPRVNPKVNNRAWCGYDVSMQLYQLKQMYHSAGVLIVEEVLRVLGLGV